MGDVNDLNVTVAFLEVLTRVPTTSELSIYSAQLAASTLTLTSLKEQLRDTAEYQKLTGTYAGNTVFDDPSWKLSLTDIYPKNYSGVTLANGKLALMTDSSHNRLKQAFISTSFDYNSFGRYANNVTETFRYTTVHIHSRDPDSVAILNASQELTMSNGNFRSSYSSSSSSVSADSSNPAISVTQDITPLRPYPYCVLQTITLSSSSPATVTLYHDIETPKDVIDNVKYGNNLITVYNDQNSATPVYFFSASGSLKDSGKPITTSTCYVFDAPTTSYANMGYNIMRSDTNVAYNSFQVTLSRASGVTTGPYTFRMSILSATMTAYDFEYPDIETQRILVNLVSRPINSIFSDNTTAWSNMWNGNIQIEPKDGITTAELDQITEMKRHIKFALYNIYSVIRDDINVEVNPMNLSTIDLSGHIFWSAELWLLPVLLLLKPRAAKALLDYRYFHLEKAKKLATAQGYKGSKFAYENDTVGYNDVYWDTVSPLTIFNTALISISTWNYYRISRDSDWLRRKGYDILRNNADFFVSKLEYDAGDGLYHMRNVIGMNNTMGDDNTMTNYLANMAVKYALEAAYEINYVSDPSWKAVLNKIYIPVRNTIVEGGVTYSNILPINASSSNSSIKFLESMVVLHPFYSRDFFNANVNFSALTIQDNVNYYNTKLTTESAINGVNKCITGTLHATVAQQENDYTVRALEVASFYTDMQTLFENATMPPWGTMYNSLFKKSFNDIAVSSSFILGMLSGVAGLRVAGGINEARFYYEDMGIKSRSANVMPNTWKKMTISGVGWSGSSYTLINTQYYSTPI
jgi:trehalose/maltose hydrolase-like predicted phosphorylase